MGNLNPEQLARLKYTLEQLGVRQRHIAKKLNKSQALLSMIFAGKRYFPANTFRRIASLYEISEQYVLTGEGEKYVISSQTVKADTSLFPPFESIQDGMNAHAQILKTASFQSFIDLAVWHNRFLNTITKRS